MTWPKATEVLVSTFLFLGFLGLLALPRQTEAFHWNLDFDQSTVSVGPSFAVFKGEMASGPTFGIEITVSHSLLWISGGFRTLLANRSRHPYLMPYIEGGCWLFINFGVGYSAGLNGDGVSNNNFHLFVGVPIPLEEKLSLWGGGFIFEPYYRPQRGLGDESPAGGWSHEVGLLFKWQIGIGK